MANADLPPIEVDVGPFQGNDFADAHPAFTAQQGDQVGAPVDRTRRFGDPRVPSPQSIELHMALKQLGVPTELFMYPGNTHGITDPRNQLVKSVSEMAWMDYYVRGLGNRFSWRDVLKTLEEAPPATADQPEV